MAEHRAYRGGYKQSRQQHNTSPAQRHEITRDLACFFLEAPHCSRNKSMSRSYNERYAEPVTLPVGDLLQLYLALAVADDYLMWLTELQGVKIGSYNTVRATVSEERR